MDKLLADRIKTGTVGVIPTDTIYGLVGSPFPKQAVKRIYELKERPTDMPFIILISNWADLAKLGIKISAKDKNILKKYWPGALSVILPCPAAKFKYLHKGTKTLAVRWPAKAIKNVKLKIKNEEDFDIIKLLKKTGPMIATSANIHGRPAAETITQAKEYFGDKVDFYLDGGKMKSPPSTLVRLIGGKMEVMRQGEMKVKN